MIKPDERVLMALNTLDRVLIEWLGSSLDAVHKAMEQAKEDHLLRQLQGEAQTLRSILNSASQARESLERIRSL
jgi:hypothetical protein